MKYIYLHVGHFADVGKYPSTMEHWGPGGLIKKGSCQELASCLVHFTIAKY
jgi:hypothetical protein